jgi:thiol-disulfide isomerase/thioredoxin
MKSSFLIVAFLVLLLQHPATAQTGSVSEKAEGEDMPVGKVTRERLQSGEFGKYFSYNYTNYAPDQQVIDDLKNKIYSYDIIIVLGTWCSDSQRDVPRFYKILDKLKYNTNSIKVYCVDRDKTAGNNDISDLNIERIPTFIFMKDGEEKGRIVESPQETLEKDMLEILNN